MRVMSKKEGGMSREEGMGGLCQGKKGRGDGRLVSREEGKGGWEAYVKGRREGGMGGLCRGKKGWEAYVKGRSEERGVKGLALPFSSK